MNVYICNGFGYNLYTKPTYSLSKQNISRYVLDSRTNYYMDFYIYVQMVEIPLCS